MVANKAKWLTGLIAFEWLLSCGCLSGRASEIKDDASLFTPAVVTAQKGVLNQLEKQYQLSVTIETYAKIPDEKQTEFKKLEKAERDPFYVKWTLERARASKARGLFVLITKEPGHLEYVVSPQLKVRGFSSSVQKEFAQKLLASFRLKQFDVGLESAVSILKDAAPTLSEVGEIKTAQVATPAELPPSEKKKSNFVPSAEKLEIGRYGRLNGGLAGSLAVQEACNASTKRN